jgi:KaiC/GvpD/RAD55 family RecA-like ATPase
MLQMMHMMQAMMGMPAVPQAVVDPSATPFTAPESPAAADEAPAEGIVRPARIEKPIRTQAALKTGTILDRLCLQDDGTRALGGIPKGCLCTLAGSPGKGKMRTAIAALAAVVKAGVPSVLVIGDESLTDGGGANTDDIATRLTRVGAEATRTSEKEFTADVLDQLNVLESHWDRADRMWDAFIQRYRFVVEKIGIRFAVIDSVGMLDPTRAATADNLAALKTYNHEHAVTCLLVGQIRESTGLPVGGSGLMHTCDVVYFIDEISLGSKEMAEFWGGNYRDKIDILTCAKSVTTPVFGFPVRVEKNPERGTISLSEMNPAAHTPPEAPE